MTSLYEGFSILGIVLAAFGILGLLKLAGFSDPKRSNGSRSTSEKDLPEL